jgi:hypothetical protein
MSESGHRQLRPRPVRDAAPEGLPYQVAALGSVEGGFAVSAAPPYLIHNGLGNAISQPNVPVSTQTQAVSGTLNNITTGSGAENAHVSVASCFYSQTSAVHGFCRDGAKKDESHMKQNNARTYAPRNGKHVCDDCRRRKVSKGKLNIKSLG